jgi:hypothetical protein
MQWELVRPQVVVVERVMGARLMGATQIVEAELLVDSVGRVLLAIELWVSFGPKPVEQATISLLVALVRPKEGAAVTRFALGQH